MKKSPDKSVNLPSRRETAKRDLHLFGNVRVLCMAAMLAALSFVLAYIAKAIQGTSPLRFTIENMPIIFAGILFGPAIGAIVGVAADLLSCLVAGMAINPLITASVAYIGLCAGIVSHYIWRHRGTAQILLCELPCHIVGSMLLKSLALAAWGYEWALLLWRIPIYVGVIILETLALSFLFKQKSIQHEIEALYRK